MEAEGERSKAQAELSLEAEAANFLLKFTRELRCPVLGSLLCAAGSRERTAGMGAPGLTPDGNERTILLTGASRGIGHGTVKMFAHGLSKGDRAVQIEVPLARRQHQPCHCRLERSGGHAARNSGHQKEAAGTAAARTGEQRSHLAEDEKCRWQQLR